MDKFHFQQEIRQKVSISPDPQLLFPSAQQLQLCV